MLVWSFLFDCRFSSSSPLRPPCQVAAILKHCNARCLPIVPQGGNTGLVGGSVPVADEVVLSLSRMNQILSLDERAGSLTCEAGCVLEALQAWWEAAQRSLHNMRDASKTLSVKT